MRAALFPGQGIDAAKVAAALPTGDPLLENANSILGYDLKRSVEQVCRRSHPVLPTEVAQPAIFVAGLISFEASLDRGQAFDCFVGHSLGEYTALVAAESISFAQGLKLVAARGAAMQRATVASSGGMAAISGLAPSDAEAVAADTGCVVANDNSPAQVVLSGETEALASAAELVRTRGGRSVLLPLAGAFHSPAMEPAVEDLARALDETEVRSPSVPVLANVTAAPYRAPGEVRRLLTRQLTERVRFRECIEWCAGHGVDDFVDLGPGRIVGRLATSTLGAYEEAVSA